MTTDEIRDLIEVCAKNGVELIEVDSLKVKFKNDSMSVVQPEPVVVADEVVVTTPDASEQNPDHEDQVLKAEELAVMAIEDPARFEDLLAHDEELINKFEEEISEG